MVYPFEIACDSSAGKCFDNEVMQRQQERYLRECSDLQKAAGIESIRTEGEIVRATEKEKIRIASAQIRKMQKEEEEERKKAIYEELRIMESGELRIITKNLRIETKPRIVTNMICPSLIVLRRAINNHEKIYKLCCRVAQNEREIFLESNSVGSGTYLVRKFASEGIIFFLPKTASQKKIALQLIAILLKNSRDEKVLPEVEGWMKKTDGTYVFVERREETWGYVKEMSM